MREMLITLEDHDAPSIKTGDQRIAYIAWNRGASVEFADNGDPVFGSGCMPIEKHAAKLRREHAIP